MPHDPTGLPTWPKLPPSSSPADAVEHTVQHAGFDIMELDRALRESAIDTNLPIVMQRKLVSQVLLGAALATTVVDEDEFNSTIARVSEPIEDDEERRFAYAFAQTLIGDFREEFGTVTSGGDADATLQSLAKRLDQFV